MRAFVFVLGFATLACGSVTPGMAQEASQTIKLAQLGNYDKCMARCRKAGGGSQINHCQAMCARAK